ncbi:TIR domain protein [Luteitalea pratensis]|uniref:TIR domain protein n=1 Tax=Luteitalea pratensis TaxID=1855912 RepID=A0A143PFA0_LUTPR|nr:toll/interleukin-1 receptor domain-containing protein [Luteitalea pratensis]AMY06953.1 TIR domain protein [Luteitalea pratensis]
MTDTLHACFISYRHPATAGSREEKLIAHVFKAISDHVEMYTHTHQVYFDQKRLVPGYQYDEKLAEAICRSACMVIVYWPAYLESDYCLQEIEAMLEIEKRRRKKLGSELHGCRLIIPFIVRGRFEDLPNAVRDGCQYLDYSRQATNPHFNIGEDEETSAKLFEIANYIKSLCDKLQRVGADVVGTCKDYGFPARMQVTQPEMAPPPPPPFPGQ